MLTRCAECVFGKRHVDALFQTGLLRGADQSPKTGLSQSEWSQSAVLCLACGWELSIVRFMAGGDSCPHCGAAFNPGCGNHYRFYFASAV
jgi:uncharacterized CHY-type Zn-finger protein